MCLTLILFQQYFLLESVAWQWRQRAGASRIRDTALTGNSRKAPPPQDGDLSRRGEHEAQLKKLYQNKCFRGNILSKLTNQIIKIFTEKSELSQQLNQDNDFNASWRLAEMVFSQSSISVPRFPSPSVPMLPLRNREVTSKQTSASQKVAFLSPAKVYFFSLNVWWVQLHYSLSLMATLECESPISLPSPPFSLTYS